VPVAIPSPDSANPFAADLAPPPDFAAPRLARVKGKGGAGFLRKLLPAMVFGVIGLAALGGVIYLYQTGYLSALGEAWKSGDKSASAIRPYDFPRHNFRLQPANRSWKEEEGIKRTQIDIRATLALRHEDPNSWMAVIAQDYKDRTPLDAELVDDGVRRLREFFKGFEYELKDRQKDLRLAGQHALRMDIQGEVNSTLMAGECWTFGYKGFAYWFVTWAPIDNAPQLGDEWESLRQGLSLLKEREGWTGPIVREATLAGTKAAYTLTYVEGVWEKQTAGDYDTRADAALLGHDQGDPKDTGKTATALVLLLDKADDLKAAATAARAYLEKRQKDVYPDTTIEEVQDKNAKAERPPDEIGNVRGRLFRLHVSNGESRERLIHLAVVSAKDQVVAIQCECDWRRRGYWEVSFDQLLRKFHLTVK
jgi:hypothetical protein